MLFVCTIDVFVLKYILSVSVWRGYLLLLVPRQSFATSLRHYLGLSYIYITVLKMARLPCFGEGNLPLLLSNSCFLCICVFLYLFVCCCFFYSWCSSFLYFLVSRVGFIVALPGRDLLISHLLYCQENDFRSDRFVFMCGRKISRKQIPGPIFSRKKYPGKITFFRTFCNICK